MVLKNNEIPKGYIINNEKIKGITTNSEIIFKINETPIEITDVLLKDKILSDNNINTNTPDFSKVATTSEGLFVTEDDDGDSYYFRGAINNNWVYFAGFYWRIIRINGNGSIRVIYNGTSTNQTGVDTHIGQCKFNPKANDNAFVGFMYGMLKGTTYEETHKNTNNSTILGSADSIGENTLNGWYNAHLKNYEKYIDLNSGFYNDRSLSSGDGIGNKNFTTYSAKSRLLDTKNPSLKSIQTNDLFTTLNSDIGNKKLSNPIGLITADEYALAGGVVQESNPQFWLYTGEAYWTMTPVEYETFVAYIFGTDGLGGLNIFSVDDLMDEFYVRPVINLKMDLQVKSDANGTKEKPYVIQENI